MRGLGKNQTINHQTKLHLFYKAGGRLTHVRILASQSELCLSARALGDNSLSKGLNDGDFLFQTEFTFRVYYSKLPIKFDDFFIVMYI